MFRVQRLQLMFVKWYDEWRKSSPFTIDDNMIAHSSMNSETTTIDEAAALAALNGDRQLLCELAQIFVEDTPGLLEEVEVALNQERIDVARRLVHSLRGLSSTFFASPTTEIAKRLEEAASQGQIDVLRDGGYQRLKTAFQELVEQLRMSGLAS